MVIAVWVVIVIEGVRTLGIKGMIVEANIPGDCGRCGSRWHVLAMQL